MSDRPSIAAGAARPRGGTPLGRAALLLLLLGLILIGPGRARAAGEAIIIAVEGASFANIILPSDPDLPDFYLEQSLTAMVREYGIQGVEAEDIITLDWYPQDPLVSSISGIRDLVELLVRESERARAEGKKLILVAHSWGTFLANAALAYATNDPAPGGVAFGRMGSLDLFLPLGSPLGHQQLALSPSEFFLTAYVDHIKGLVQAELGPVQVPQGIGRIVNYWAWGDVISGPLSETPWLAGLTVEDHAADLELEGFEPHLYRRNSINTVVWHFYDSLTERGLIDNSRFRQEVAGLIKETLAD